MNKMAISATLHCLMGCAVGEVAGMIIGMGLGWSSGATIALAVVLAFSTGYALSALPLVRAGMAVGAAFRIVLAADTLSIITMELVDNTVMAVIPGAMDSGLHNPVFWVSMAASLGVAFIFAWPVNLWLLRRGKGHALIHPHHH